MAEELMRAFEQDQAEIERLSAENARLREAAHSARTTLGLVQYSVNDVSRLKIISTLAALDLALAKAEGSDNG